MRLNTNKTHLHTFGIGAITNGVSTIGMEVTTPKVQDSKTRVLTTLYRCR